MAEFDFELVSPERQLVSGKASEVVVPGSEGQFTVLENHAPFLSTLKAGILDVTMAGGEKTRIFVRGGFADASPKGLTVLAEEAVPVSELKAETLAQSIRNAEEDVKDAKDDMERQAAAERLAELKEVQAAVFN